VILIETVGTVMHWDDGAELLYGCSAAEVLGRSIRELDIHSEDAATAAAVMRQLGAGGTILVWLNQPVGRRVGR
jgi:PAS domain S-box-containing protein